MRFRFVHAADIHLGYEQYNLAKRADDFARAYFAVVDHAIAVSADFVIIAGDLFHRANADAWTLKQATAGLTRLREAGIPVVAVEGNHDAQHARKNLSWMEYLCDQDLLSLLNVVVEPNGYKMLAPFDSGSRRGSYVDLAGARIYGLKYYGAATARVLEQVHEQIDHDPAGYTILMLHAGLEGQVPHLHGGLTAGQILPLRPSVDYLALGHIHKRLDGEADWIYNPGSTETNTFEEMEWPHGFFDVQVDTALPLKHQVQAIETPSLRPFHRISVSAEGCGSLDEFVARAEEQIEAQHARRGPAPAERRPVIELHLGGVAEFRRQDVPVERLKGAVELLFSPLVVRVRNSLVPPGLVTVRSSERMTREELERQVVGQLVYQQAEHRDSADAWSRLILDVKRMAVEKDLPANIADHVRATIGRMGSEGTELPAEVAPEMPPDEDVRVLEAVPRGKQEQGRGAEQESSHGASPTAAAMDGMTVTQFDAPVASETGVADAGLW